VLVNYYLPQSYEAYGFPRFGSKGEFRDSKVMLRQDLTRIVGSAQRVWVIRAFQNVPSIGYQAYLTNQWFRDNGFSQAEHLILNKSESVLFVRPVAATPFPSNRGVTP
jgi:hypothetical protein